MGFDIYGRAPRSEAGKYIGITHDVWCEMAQRFLDAAPELRSKIIRPELDESGRAFLDPGPRTKEEWSRITSQQRWFSNDGFGLCDVDSIALAEVLERSDRGSTERDFAAFLRDSDGFKLW